MDEEEFQAITKSVADGVRLAQATSNTARTELPWWVNAILGIVIAAFSAGMTWMALEARLQRDERDIADTKQAILDVTAELKELRTSNTSLHSLIIKSFDDGEKLNAAAFAEAKKEAQAEHERNQKRFRILERKLDLPEGN